MPAAQKYITACIQLFAVLAIFPLPVSAAETLNLSLFDSSRQTIGRHISWLEDRKSSMDIQDIISCNSDRQFQSLDHDIPSFGYSKNRYWFRVTLDNDTQETISRMLYFEVSWLDELDVYQVQNCKVVRSWQAGDTRPYKSGQMAYQYPAFPLKFDPGATELYFSAKTREAMVIPVYLYSSDSFYDNNTFIRSYYGILYGALGLILLYNFILFLSSREKVYLFYCLYLAGFLNMNMGYNGFSYWWFLKDSPSIASNIHIHNIFGYQYLGILFAMTFLNTRSAMPGSHRVLTWLMIAMGTTHLVSTLGGLEHLGHAGSVAFSAVYAPFILFIALLALNNGNRSVRYFALASFSSLFGSLMTTLSALGAIPFTFTGFRGADIGFLVDAALLSMAVGYKFQILREEREKNLEETVKKQTLDLLEIENRMISQNLEESREIQNKLTKANKTKSRFFSVIAHDLRGPIGSIKDLLEMLSSEIESYPDMSDEEKEEFRKILHTTAEQSNTTYELLENLLTWALSQQDMVVYNITNNPAENIILPAINLIKMQAAGKNITINTDCSEDMMLNCDVRTAHTAVRNILSNAVKFSFRDSAIDISVKKAGEFAQIRIRDYGAGLPPQKVKELLEHKQLLSTKGTENEKGTGLGLQLVFEYIQGNHGSLEIESEEGKGSTFIISLPLALQSEPSQII